MILFLLGMAVAGPLERVEFLSDDPGGYLVEEAPLLLDRPGMVGLAWLAQVQPVWALPGVPLTIGTSVRSQSLAWEPELGEGRGASLGLSTRLGFPAGAFGTLLWARDGLVLGLGVRAHCAASWSAPRLQGWVFGPSLVVGWRPHARNASVSHPLGKPEPVD